MTEALYTLFLQKALALLSKRAYTVLSMKKKLIEFTGKEKKKILERKSRLEDAKQEALTSSSEEELEDSIKKVLGRLKELRYLDDTQFGSDFIDNRTAFRPRGAFLLKRELERKGIHPDLVKRLLEEKEIDEEVLAGEALKKKLKTIQKYPRQKQKEKAMRFLSSRGFKIDAIYKVIDHWYNNTAI